MTPRGRTIAETGRASSVGRIVLCIAGLLAFGVFLALGTWQVQRLSWKLALIERVDARIHAAPSAPPTAADWSAISAERDEYRRLRLTGTFLNDRETLVQAVTALGPGFWVLTPLRLADGSAVIVNRGFVPPERRDPATRAAGQVEGATAVTGLLRLSEPDGGFLRENDPAENRWYSRDVAAIAEARDLPATAPYFLDADATANAGGWPIGGLTVVAFRNHHLVYALTWYALAAMLAGVGAWLWRDRQRRSAMMTAGEDVKDGQPVSLP